MWSTVLPNIICNYNRTPHDITGLSPEYLLFGIDKTPSFGTSFVPIEEARQLSNERTEYHQQQRKRSHDKKHKDFDPTIGSRVVRIIASNDPQQKKTSPRYSGPYIVTRKIARKTYKITDSFTGQSHKATTDQI